MHRETKFALCNHLDPHSYRCQPLPSCADCDYGRMWPSESHFIGHKNAEKMTCFADAWSLCYDLDDVDNFSDYYCLHQHSGLCRHFSSIIGPLSCLFWSYLYDGKDYRCSKHFSAENFKVIDMASPNPDRLPQSQACGQSPRLQFEISVYCSGASEILKYLKQNC